MMSEDQSKEICNMLAKDLGWNSAVFIKSPAYKNRQVLAFANDNNLAMLWHGFHVITASSFSDTPYSNCIKQLIKHNATVRDAKGCVTTVLSSDDLSYEVLAIKAELRCVCC